MKLPHADKLDVDREKVVEYLLNEAHPDNGGKAAFFLALGFDREKWPVLAAALRQVAMTGEIVTRVSTTHGTKLVVDGRIETPGGGSPFVRTVWIIDIGRDSPRLVTAYPSDS